jgi:hypothetical protein
MVFETLAALDRTQVADDAEMAVTHASQMAVLEVPHAVSMHWMPIPSILDLAESNAAAEACGRRLAGVRAGRLRWPQIFLPSKYGPAIKRRRRCALVGNERLERGSFCRPFKTARLIVEAF